jgi:hypothetical protein
MTEPSADEFTPLPYYPFDARPDGVPLDAEEVATALFLDHGRVDRAAARLQVDQRQLKKAIRGNASLRLLLARLA